MGQAQLKSRRPPRAARYLKGYYVPTEILVSSDPWENRVAILEDNQLAEIYFEREEKVIGSIFKGKVMNVLPGMGASFVDIGLGRNAFLYVDDINKTPLNIGDVEITQGRSGWTITEKISKGDDVLVQIVKEPRGLKGARISTNISLPGRYLILMPTGRYSGVSRKIESADERNRLKGIMKLIRPEGMATVVRTAAGGVSQAELLADLGVLIRMWHGILESYKRAPSPSLIHKDMNLVYKAARDFITPEVERVLIDDPEEYEKVRDFMRLLGPQYVERIELYNHGRSLFKDFKVDEEVQKLLRPKINLPSGGSIVIETTEALTVIDVNSGKFTGGKNLEDTIVKTNIEAAAEIARQVRLRDIGGIIVCDFIDMSSEQSRNRVLSTLEGGLRKDRTRTTIQSFSALGLLEFTRKRVGKDLAGQLRGPCPTCAGLGSVMSPESVAIEAFRSVRRLGHEHKNGATKSPIEVVSAPTVGAQIDYWYDTELRALEKELDTRVAVRVDVSLHPERTRIGLVSDQALLDGATSARVGDELEVELLSARLPVPTSALAVVGDRLIEVENGANAAGQTIKIKVIDIDEDGTILAEPRGPVAVVGGDGKKRRRRGGRGRKLTSAEQEEQLRELAEEAAKGLGGRPAIGISTEAEAEAEEAEAREHTPSSPPLAEVVSTAPHVPEYAAVDADGEQRAYGTYGGPADADPQKRRRRRRRRRPGANDTATLVAIANAAGIPLPPGIKAPPQAAAAAAPVEPNDDLDAAEDALVELGQGTVDGAGRRRRRRRRRRGRGGSDRPVEGAAGDGEAAAGASAPSRAIARVDDKHAPVALQAPPPSLSVSEPAPKVTKPARTRRARTTTGPAAATVSSVTVSPAPAAAPAAADAAAPKRRGRPPKAAAAVPPAAPAVAAAAPSASAARGRTAKANPVAATPAPAKPTAPARKKPAATAAASAKKSTAAKKSPAAAPKAAPAPAPTKGRKAPASKAAPARKKATTTRKKKA
jgi:ribonuclease G